MLESVKKKKLKDNWAEESGQGCCFYLFSHFIVQEDNKISFLYKNLLKECMSAIFK